MKTALFIALLLPTTAVFSQQAYRHFISRAELLYQQKQYQQSALTFDSAITVADKQPAADDWYNAACSWALAGDKEKAFNYLQKAAVQGKWSNLSHLLSDNDLTSLHADARWQPLTNQVKQNKETSEANMDKWLVARLDSIYHEDQDPRKQLDSIEHTYGPNAQALKLCWKSINEKDSINLVKVKNIIDTYGWPSPAKVGEQGALTVFLVIQHADLATQEKYLPLMRAAVQQGNAQPQKLALLEDRVLVRQGKKQLYGSQVRSNATTSKMEFFPIEDEPNVNNRRAAVGLGPLEDYAKYFGIDYTVPKPE